MKKIINEDMLRLADIEINEAMKASKIDYCMEVIEKIAENTMKQAREIKKDYNSGVDGEKIVDKLSMIGFKLNMTLTALSELKDNDNKDISEFGKKVNSASSKIHSITHGLW